MPALRVVRQPHTAQFVIYSVPDDVAAAFDCEGQLTLGDPKPVKRDVRQVFRRDVHGRRPSVTIRSPCCGPRKTATGRSSRGRWVRTMQGLQHLSRSRTPRLARISADPTLVQAARGFLDSWLVRKNYDAAFAYVSPKAYACYDLERDPAQPASTSPEDAGRKLRAGLEAAGATVGTSRSLDAMLSAPEPLHPAVRVMDHSFSRVFSLTSMPNALADVAECAARAAGSTVPDPLPAGVRSRLQPEHSIQARAAETHPCCACSGARRTTPGASPPTASSGRRPPLPALTARPRDARPPSPSVSAVQLTRPPLLFALQSTH